MTVSRPCNVLMLYPLFTAESFWSFGESCKLMGVRRPAAPLGLITVAAMLPRELGRPARRPQHRGLRRRRSRLGRPRLDRRHAAAAGRYAASDRHVPRARQAGGGRRAGSRRRARTSTRTPTSGCSARPRASSTSSSRPGTAARAPACSPREKFKADVTKTPMPRFDLLKFERLSLLGVQYSRGCPFTCEFCDIIELYGRVPRTKTTDADARRARARSTSSAIAVMSTSSTTISSATRRR